MTALASAFDASSLDAEFLRYVPIGVVACTEGFFRAAFRQVVDADQEFFERATRYSVVRDLKLDLNLLQAVHGRKITVGELIAHVVPTNSLEQIDSFMTALMGGKSFLNATGTVHSRVNVEIYGQPMESILSNPAQVFSDTQKLFELRHIFVHELAEDYPVPLRSELAVLLESAVAFLNASAEVVGNLLQPDAPLTQLGMNQAASDALARTEEEVAAIQQDLVSLGFSATEMRDYAATWEVLKRRHSEFAASGHEGGSIYPLIYATAAQEIAEMHRDVLKRQLEDIKSRLH